MSPDLTGAGGSRGPMPVVVQSLMVHHAGAIPADPASTKPTDYATAEEQPAASTSQPEPSDESLCKISALEHPDRRPAVVVAMPEPRPQLPHPPGVPLKGPQLLHQRSDSAFSTAESSGLATGPRPSSSSTDCELRQRPAGLPEEYPAHRYSSRSPSSACYYMPLATGSPRWAYMHMPDSCPEHDNSVVWQGCLLWR